MTMSTAQAFREGRSRRNRQDAINMADALDNSNQTINNLQRKVASMEHDAGSYQNFLARKKESPGQVELDIFGEMRPDLFNTETTQDNKRWYNLRLIAWSEWWFEALRGNGMKAKLDLPKVRGLSDAIQKGDADPIAAIKALNDIGDRMELSLGLDNPREWVEKRVKEMGSSKGLKFHKDDPTVPIIETVGPLSAAAQLRSIEKGSSFDPIGTDIYGIGDMVQR